MQHNEHRAFTHTEKEQKKKNDKRDQFKNAHISCEITN